MNIENKLEMYRAMKIELAELKQKEMDLRVDIASELSSSGLEAGTHNFQFTGMKVKLVSKLNYSVDKNILEGLVLSEGEAECLRWKPELNLTKFKQADDIDTLEEAIIIKTGAPTLTVEIAE